MSKERRQKVLKLYKNLLNSAGVYITIFHFFYCQALFEINDAQRNSRK